MYDPDSLKLEEFRLAKGSYRPIAPDSQGRLWSEQLRVSLGLWHGIVSGCEYPWVRLFRLHGSLVPTEAEAERQRAESAEAELARLRSLLAERGRTA